MAVAIVVHEGAARAPARIGVLQAGLFGYLGECPVAVVAIEFILPVEGAKEIFPTVVIVIAHTNSRGPARELQAGLFCDVRKRAITIIFVQAVGGTWRRSRHRRATEQKNVHPAVIVVVEKSAATANGFEDVVLVIGLA